MNKMNKKGFTLIEMLVVIAIIAVLVSIIVPVVGNSTAKAKAATDAANLRSVAASAAIDWLDNNTFDKDADSYGVTCKTYENAALTITYDETSNSIVAKFGDYGVDHFATIAETGKAPSAKG